MFVYGPVYSPVSAPGGSQYCPGTISSSSGPGSLSSCSLLPNALFLAHFTSLTTGKDSSAAVNNSLLFEWNKEKYGPIRHLWKDNNSNTRKMMKISFIA